MDPGAENYRLYLSGDDTGLIEIIKEYRDGLIFFVNGFVNDLYAAEEIAENTFVKLAVKKPLFLGRSSFKTWLYSIGRNEARSFLRRNSRFSYIPLDDAETYAYSGLCPETEYFRQKSRRTLHAALRRLTPEQHQALWLFYFENMSCRDVAKLTGRSTHAAESLLSRARQALKAELVKEGTDIEDL